MLSRPLTLRYLLPPLCAFLYLHAMLPVVIAAHAAAVSDAFALVAALAALMGCCWRAPTVPASARLPWTLLSAGLLLWTVGRLLALWETRLQHTSASVSSLAALSSLSALAFVLYGAPVLLALSALDQEQRVPLFLWLDGIQATLIASLAYLTFSGTALQPLAAGGGRWLFLGESLVLAGAATLRLLARPQTGEERRFVQILSVFLWAAAGCAGMASYAALRPELQPLSAVLGDIPLLLLAGAALVRRPFPTQTASPAAPTQLATLLDHASPIFYTTALLALATAMARVHVYLGISAVLVALAGYGIRTLTLQTRLARVLQELRQARDQLGEMSLQDGLTSIANRRSFEQMLDLEWGRAIRTQHPLSLLLIDIDHFRNLNDRYGHRYGDQCLVEIAATLRSTLPRSSDLLARFGGEEFAAVLPATDLNGAKSVAERMQEAVRALGIPNPTAIGQFATVSVGLSVYEFPQAGSPAALIEASDRGLAKAKQSGRNRIEHGALPTLLDADAPLSGI